MGWIFKILDWYRNYRLAIIEAETKAANRPHEILADITRSNTQMIQGWLESFRVHEVPASSIVREEDEYHAEQERLHPAVQQSIKNAIKGGAFPDLTEILNQ